MTTENRPSGKLERDDAVGASKQTVCNSPACVLRNIMHSRLNDGYSDGDRDEKRVQLRYCPTERIITLEVGLSQDFREAYREFRGEEDQVDFKSEKEISVGSVGGNDVRAEIEWPYHKGTSNREFRRETDRRFRPYESGAFMGLAGCRQAAGTLVTAVISLMLLFPSILGADISVFEVHNSHEHTSIRFFLLVVYLRMFLGLNFMDFDKSLASELSLSDRYKIIVERWARVVLLAILFALTVTLRSEDERLLGILLFVALCLPILYLLVFFEELFMKDPDRSTNIAIAIGDGLSLTLGLMALGILPEEWVNGLVSWLNIEGFTLLFIVLCLVFLSEVTWVYSQSLKDSSTRVKRYFLDSAFR